MSNGTPWQRTIGPVTGRDDSENPWERYDRILQSYHPNGRETSGQNGTAVYSGMTGTGSAARRADGTDAADLQKVYGAGEGSGVREENSEIVRNPGQSTVRQPGRKSSPAECETCKNRKYVDGSNESDVSFKTPAHIDPGSAASAVMAHEQEHVSNAYEKAEKGDGKVLEASVRLKTDVCPECGRVYVSGGETTTRIAYSKDTGDGGNFDRKA